LQVLECLRPGDSRKGSDEADVDEKEDDGEGRGGPLFCAACGYVITSTRERTEVSGACEHTFVNPHGIVFHIGCFRRAPGCGAKGRASAFFSWFPGYEWRIAVCRGCHSHLGWSFGNPPSFHGLILDRLKEDP